MKVLAVSIVALAGCGGSDDLSDLQSFMEGVRARQEADIGPLPRLEEAAPIAYRASGRRSPFVPWVSIGEIAGQTNAVAIAPDFSRPMQRLERHPISAISLVGSLSRGGLRYGLVRDAQGVVHRVGVGDYLGRDHGRVRFISPVAIELVEIVPDGADGWVERERVVAREVLRGSLEAEKTR